VATRGIRDDEERPTLDEVTATVRSLVEIMRGNGLTELDVSAGDVSIRLRTPKGGGGSKTAATRADAKHAADAPIAVLDGHIVTAPMIGTFYSSPSPGDLPFVRIGDHVQSGQTIGIIEAMKIMNEIVADRSGVVLEILAVNAQAVEYGSPLLRLDLDGEGDG
jgi:acetyl-CoA carboxylase biotin carboxyl carrier protein